MQAVSKETLHLAAAGTRPQGIHLYIGPSPRECMVAQQHSSSLPPTPQNPIRTHEPPVQIPLQQRAEVGRHCSSGGQQADRLRQHQLLLRQPEGFLEHRAHLLGLGRGGMEGSKGLGGSDWQWWLAMCVSKTPAAQFDTLSFPAVAATARLTHSSADSRGSRRWRSRPAVASGCAAMCSTAQSGVLICSSQPGGGGHAQACLHACRRLSSAHSSIRTSYK